MDHPYLIGFWNGFDSEPECATLAEAAEAIRLANGWTEVHLSDQEWATEASVPIWIAYPSKEALLRAEGIDTAVVGAPHIWKMA